MMAVKVFVPLLLSLCATATYATGINSLETICSDPDPSPLHFDLFLELLSNHTKIAEKLKPAPLFADMDPNAPAYDITGNGFYLSNGPLSADIKRALCNNNEVTIYFSMFLKETHSSGTILSISSAHGSRLPVFGVAINAAADNVMFTYRHRGKPRTVTTQIRLHPGRWRDYALVLSGHLLQFYFDCNLVFSEILALPDFCVDESNFVVSFADDSDRAEIENNDGIYAFFQKVGFYFGRNGIRTQCPQAGLECPSCGQYLRLVQKAHELKEEVERLEAKLAQIKRQGFTPTNEVRQPSNCNNDTTVSHGAFTVLATGATCFCQDGTLTCTTELTCSVPPTSSTTEPKPLNSPTCTDCSGENQVCNSQGQCVCGSGFRMYNGSCFSGNEVCATNEIPPTTIYLPLQHNEFAYMDSMGGVCRVFFCVPKLGSPTGFARNFECSSNYTTSVCHNGQLDPFQREMAICCQVCTDCDFITCGNNSRCATVGNREKCVCNEHYEMVNGVCVDINECVQDDLNRCPINSTCINMDPEYRCECVQGYMMSKQKVCEDVDECSSGIATLCPSNSVCNNTIGSYDCRCLSGYTKTRGKECVPVCDVPCANGGSCTGPNTCTCHSGYTGPLCQDDIDECSLRIDACSDQKSECVNTIGGYFCRCKPGYRGNGSYCEDVNECESEIHKCVRNVARCLNTLGSYICLCSGLVDCTGTCRLKQQLFYNGQTTLDRSNTCRNCTCSDGELFCEKRLCDCQNPRESRRCCRKCFPTRNCHLNVSVSIRPNSLFVDPANPCIRWNCSPKLILSREDLSPLCPPLNCSPQFQQHQPGRCCPICLLPSCSNSIQGQTLPMINGCKRCTCQSSLSGPPKWQCNNIVSCNKQSNCAPENILFYDKQCCPICERDVLGTTCQTLIP